MNVDVVLEQRFYRCANHQYWTENAFPNAFWHRYLSVFQSVTIVARVAYIDQPDKQWHRVDSNRVCFLELPIYIGPLGFIENLPRIVRQLKTRRHVKRAVVLRVPGILSTMYQLFAMKSGQTFAAEIVGDPQDTFSANASKHPLRPFIAYFFTRLLKNQCAQASATSYVTERSLQERYPHHPARFSTHYSSITLSEADYKKVVRYQIDSPLRIVCIGNLSQPYKGCDAMLKCMAIINKKETVAKLSWIGGGSLQSEMQALSEELHIAEAVNFIGNVAAREDIRSLLDDADVFVLCSRQEGLPRVLIEAMARSRLCIATNVGGVKELLEPSYIIERDDIDALRAKLHFIQTLSEDERIQVARRNYEKAREYDDTTLQARRNQMYQTIYELSQS
uniref:glycosyltransferase n=1 Tax=Ningiella ruwaisensis TaxID=2364274 RepID=UPI00109F823D|nr:glycosyltransferase [Ningiella ruwaisensis]